MRGRSLLWVLFVALGVGGAVTGVRLFSVAVPSVSIDIVMDRGEALEQAAELAAEYGWGAQDDRSAASFGADDPEVQTYVELEAGGPEAFARLAGGGVYEPYQWRVRRFAERRVEEASVAFTPRGEPYGFRLRLGEDDPGDGNLEPPTARALAEATATEWGVDLGVFRLLDASQETLPGGRVDHALVYERTDEFVGEGRFRLRLRVAGSRPSELAHFVYVPQAFSRRYAEMRATNDAIALGSQAVFLIVFVLLGAGVGSALLLRAGWLEWRKPLAWGGVIAFLFGLNTVNQLPLAWMAYDTALSASDFVLRQVGASVAIGLLGTPLIAFFLLAGESLGRRAFGDHVQQWRFWSGEVATSRTALGMTIAAYLLVGIQVGYVVLFYLGTQRLEGWWSPADALVQPDLLATYMPWLQAVSVALFASFWEESVFRAVPIACAALLGARYGRRTLFIWSAVVLQAVVFAAAHANYPQQPPYARVVELTAPALMWGIVYLRYGLVPTILAHFLYDLSLISVVLFESRALADQLVIGAVGLVPLGVLLVARLRIGGRDRPPADAFNRSWAPRERESSQRAVADAEPEAVADPELQVEARSSSASLGQGARRAVPAWVAPALTVLGLVLWIGALRSGASPPRLWGDAAAARSAAAAELGARGVSLEEWSVYVTASAGPTAGRRYVYLEAGPAAFARLRGTYLDAPSWIVRLVNWEAPPESRVEEYRVWVGPSGSVPRTVHSLPEGRSGSTLSVDSARSVALDTVRVRLGLGPARLREVEAQETTLPDRTDWTFAFAETGLLRDVEGEARVQVRVAGDEIVDMTRSVRVPEAWAREQREIESRRTIMAGGLALLLIVCFAGAAVVGVVTWSRGRLVRGVASRIAAPAIVAVTLSAANSWPATEAGFSTAQPWGLQAAAVAIALVFAVLLAGPAIGSVGALGVTWLRDVEAEPERRGLPVALGLLLGGFLAAVRTAFAGAPALPDYTGAATRIPSLDAALRSVLPYLLMTVALLAVALTRRRFRERHLIQSSLLTLLAVGAVVLVPVSLQASLPLWGLAALLGYGVLLIVLRIVAARPTWVPTILGAAMVLDVLGLAWDAPYAGARPGGVLAALVLALLAWSSTRLLSSGGEDPHGPSQSVDGSRASVGSV